MTGLLIAGTTSDAGKSVVVTGLCRALARRGVRVAPFKAQNMSNNSMVVRGPDGGLGEIGRAQWIQALAAGVEPEVAMNPVLLKPGSDRRSHVIRMGLPDGEISAREFAEPEGTTRAREGTTRAREGTTRAREGTTRGRLARTAFAAFDDLSARFDVVIAEGAGSPAEINLRDSDYVNLGLAQHAGLPVVVVGDIDRGGWFAASYGTLAVLEPGDQRLIAGFVANKFRGDVSLLEPGLKELARRTGRRTYGVLPWHPDLWLDAEDALDLDARRAATQHPPERSGPRRVAVVRLPRVSNFTDVDALGLEPDLDVYFVSDPRRLADADLVVLPGTRSTRADLAWLRASGLADAIVRHAEAGRPVLGICGGCQMLGRSIADPDGIEGAPGTVDGLGLLDLHTTFSADKTLRVHEPAGYEIHHGTVSGQTRAGPVTGTMVHGSLEDDAAREEFLAETLGITARASFAQARQRRLDLLGDLVEEHLDVDALLGLARDGVDQPAVIG